jgi:hypothetical protein
VSHLDSAGTGFRSALSTAYFGTQVRYAILMVEQRSAEGEEK